MCFEFLKISSTQSARNSSQNPKRTKMQAVKGFFASSKYYICKLMMQYGNINTLTA